MPKRPHDRRGEATYYTYMWLWMAALRALEQSAVEKGSAYNRMLAVIATAFMLEAYLNHLGQQKVTDWFTVERGMTPKQRLKAVASAVGLTLDHKSAQYQAFIELFEAREQLAHGRTTTISGTWREADERPGATLSLKPKWLKASSGARPKQLFTHAEALIKGLHKHSGLVGRPFDTLSTGMSGPR